MNNEEAVDLMLSKIDFVLQYRLNKLINDGSVPRG